MTDHSVRNAVGVAISEVLRDHLPPEHFSTDLIAAISAAVFDELATPLDEQERLRSALNEALDQWESWHSDRHDDEPNPRIAELRGLAWEIPPGDRLRMQRLAELNVGEIERGPLSDAESGERSDLRRALGRHVNPFVDLVHGRPDGGVDIEIDHPRGPLRWELPSERAEQLREALDFIIVRHAAPGLMADNEENSITRYERMDDGLSFEDTEASLVKGMPTGLSTQQGYHWMMLRVLDLRVQAACTERGLVACNGRDSDQACELTTVGNGDMHSATAEFAIALADLLDDPGDRSHGRVTMATQRLVHAVRTAFEGKPRPS